eukprot:371139-Amorphochlora_amoeboformis.AAC.1
MQASYIKYKIPTSFLLHSSNVSVAVSLPVVVLSTGKAAQVPSVKSVLIDASDSYDPAKLNNTQRSR